MTAPGKKTEKQIVIDNLYKIEDMTSNEIEEYKKKISVSTLSQKGKSLLWEACEVKQEELNGRASVMATNGDLDDIRSKGDI